LEKVLNTGRFTADEGFRGATRPRDGPVEFEKDSIGEEPSGLKLIENEVKKGKSSLYRVREQETSANNSAGLLLSAHMIKNVIRNLEITNVFSHDVITAHCTHFSDLKLS